MSREKAAPVKRRPVAEGYASNAGELPNDLNRLVVADTLHFALKSAIKSGLAGETAARHHDIIASQRLDPCRFRIITLTKQS